MTRALLLCAALALMPATALAQPAAKQAETAAKAPKLGARELAVAWEVRDSLTRLELAALAHVDKVAPKGGKHDALLDRLVGIVLERREALAQALAARIDRAASPAVAADAMHLVGQLYMDARDSMARHADIRGFVLEKTRAPELQQKALSWWDRLAREHPKHPKLGTVLDQLSQAYFDEGDYERAKRSLQRLLCANRARELAAADAVVDKADDTLGYRVRAQSVTLDSYDGCRPLIRDRDRVDDAWLRLAWLHRTGGSELALAVSAYEQVTNHPDSPSYFVGLQELANTRYEAGQLLEAIPPLDALMEYLDRRRIEDPDTFDDGMAAVRAEAVRRTGRIVAELWRESALPKPNASLDLALIYYRGRTRQHHVHDVFVATGDALRALGAFDQAMPVWRYVLKTWPEHPQAPSVEQQIVRMLVEKGDPRAADREREALVAAFDGDTRWRTANHSKKKTLAAADRIIATALTELADGHFRQAAIAHQARPTSPTAADRKLYDDAVAYSRRVMQRFPGSKVGYEAAFQLAQALSYRGDDLEAARQFRAVRERDPRGAHYLEATRAMVFTYQQAVADEKPFSSLPDKAALAKPTPRPLSTKLAELVHAYTDLAATTTSPEEIASMLYYAALVQLSHQQIAEARRLLDRVIDEQCQTRVARDAASWVAKIEEAQGDSGLRVAAQKLLNRACGDNSAVRLVRRTRIEAAVAEARKVAADGRQLDAARIFYGAYRESLPGDPSRDGALLGAAQAFTAAARPETALRILRPFLDDSSSQTSPDLAMAAWLAGQAAEQLFAYDQAVDAFLQVASLADKAGYKSGSGFDLAAHVPDALWRAAELRELDRVYYDRGPSDPGAATLYLRYAKQMARDRTRASDAYLRAARVYQQAGDTAALERTYKAWNAAYGKGKDAQRYRVRFQFRIAKARVAAGDRRGAANAFLEVVDAYGKLGKQAGRDEAELAAEAAFWRAERIYAERLEPHLFRWPDDSSDEKAVEQRITALANVGQEAAAGFEQVLALDTDWSIAAQVRIGDVYLAVFDKIVGAPPPRKVSGEAKGDEDLISNYVKTVRSAVQPIADEAKNRWQQAIDLAHKRNVTDRWSRLARQRLNAHVDAKAYPVLREEILVPEELP